MERKQIAEEMQALNALVEGITGLTSRWSGVVHILDTPTMLLMKGRINQAEKEWSCDITVHQALVHSPSRWRTLIHELLHAVSPGLTPEDYKRWRGWEEAVIEQVQRHIRPQILAHLGVQVEETIFLAIESDWPYNTYIEALEELRIFAGVEAEAFYMDLLRVPLPQRIGFVRSLRNGPAFLHVLARTAGKLR